MLKPGETYAEYCYRTTDICDYPDLPADVLADEEFLDMISAYCFIVLAQAGDRIPSFAMEKVSVVFNRRAETEDSFRMVKENKGSLGSPARYYL